MCVLESYRTDDKMMNCHFNMGSLSKILFLIFLEISISSCQTNSDADRIFENIIKSNNPRIRPVVEQSKKTTVFLTYFLNSINGYAEASQTLKTSGYLELDWYDEFLTWNVTEYGGVTNVKPHPKNMWKPAIAVKNAVDFKKMVSPAYSMNLLSNGLVVWYPRDDLETYCSMDVTMFPFDTQTCTIEFFITSDPLSVVDLYPKIDHISLTAFQKSNEWELMNTTVVREVRQYSQFEFSFVVVSMTLNRKTSSLIMSVLLSVFILAFLNIFVFIVAAESGEKISFSITGLLTYTVLLGFVTEALPKTSDTTSILAAFVGAMTVVNAVYVFLAIISLRIFHRDDRIHPVPAWVGRLVSFFDWCGKIELKPNELKPKRCLTVSQRPAVKTVTWKNVSRTYDKVLFVVFFASLTTTTCTLFLLYM